MIFEGNIEFSWNTLGSLCILSLRMHIEENQISKDHIYDLSHTNIPKPYYAAYCAISSGNNHGRAILGSDKSLLINMNITSNMYAYGTMVYIFR